jgi:hypothetical protein
MTGREALVTVFVTDLSDTALDYWLEFCRFCEPDEIREVLSAIATEADLRLPLGVVLDQAYPREQAFH